MFKLDIFWELHPFTIFVLDYEKHKNNVLAVKKDELIPLLTWLL